MTDPSPREFHDKADVSARRIAKVYATALLDTAAQRAEADTVLAELETLVRDVFTREPRLEMLLSSAAIGRRARQKTLQEIFGGRASDTFLNFLQVLNDHERLDLLRPILTAALAMNDERNRRLRVMVTSAVPLPDEARVRLENDVRNRFHREPVLIPHVDAGILGGLKVRIGDMQYDASVRNRLDTLRDQIIARCSHEIQSRRDRFSSGE